MLPPFWWAMAPNIANQKRCITKTDEILIFSHQFMSCVLIIDELTRWLLSPLDLDLDSTLDNVEWNLAHFLWIWEKDLHEIDLGLLCLNIIVTIFLKNRKTCFVFLWLILLVVNTWERELNELKIMTSHLSQYVTVSEQIRRWKLKLSVSFALHYLLRNVMQFDALMYSYF